MIHDLFGSIDVLGVGGLPEGTTLPDESTPPGDTVESDAALADRIVEVYWHRARATGLGVEQARAARSRLRAGAEDSIRHFRATDPEELTALGRSLDRYDRLRAAAGVDRTLLEEPSRLLPGALGHVQAVVEAVAGALPALIGVVTGGLPLVAVRAHVRRVAERQPGGPLPIARLRTVATVTFAVFYAALTALVAWQFSRAATVTFALLVAPCGVFALVYVRRMRAILAHLGNRTAAWFKLGPVTRVREAQDELVAELDRLRNRYREEVHGWDALPANAARRTLRGATARVAFIGATLLAAGLFVWTYLDQPIEGLPLGPSPWQQTRAADPATAERELLRDARGVLLAARQLDRMEAQMATLYAEFLQGDRNLLTQGDHDDMRALLVTYLDLRSTLLKAVWLYRGDNRDASVSSTDPLEQRAFLTAYAAAALLAEKGWRIYDTFHDDETSRAQLDRGDAAWGIPPGTYSNISASLTNQSVMAELEMATRRFDRDRRAGLFPFEAPWSELAERAAGSGPAVEAALAGIGRRRLQRTLRDMAAQLNTPSQEVTPLVSLAVSRFRFKERPPHRGLISPRQVEGLRAELRPGDILIERRNWYISNGLLPGFWPHAALYLGSASELAELGVARDPRAAPHMDDFAGEDELGRDYAVIEAIGEGVVFTSLEQSVGEADAVAVLRPNLTPGQLREALGRALSHRGKEYDFDFDFQTTDRLVCTELVFRTYDGILDLPEMRMIMGQPRLAAVDYVRMWADGRSASSPALDLITFLDFDEANQRAVPADAAALVETLDRSRFTFVR